MSPCVSSSTFVGVPAEMRDSVSAVARFRACEAHPAGTENNAAAMHANAGPGTIDIPNTIPAHRADN